MILQSYTERPHNGNDLYFEKSGNSLVLSNILGQTLISAECLEEMPCPAYGRDVIHS